MTYTDKEFHAMREARVAVQKEEMLREEEPVPNIPFLANQIAAIDAIEDAIADFEKGMNQARIEIQELRNKGQKICESIKPHLSALNARFVD